MYSPSVCWQATERLLVNGLLSVHSRGLCKQPNMRQHFGYIQQWGPSRSVSTEGNLAPGSIFFNDWQVVSLKHKHTEKSFGIHLPDKLARLVVSTPQLMSDQNLITLKDGGLPGHQVVPFRRKLSEESVGMHQPNKVAHIAVQVIMPLSLPDRQNWGVHNQCIDVAPVHPSDNKVGIHCQPYLQGSSLVCWLYFIEHFSIIPSVTTVTFCNPHQCIPETSAPFPSPQARSWNPTLVPDSQHPFPTTLDHSWPDRAQPDRLYLSLISSSSLSLASSHTLPLPLSCSLRLTLWVLHLHQPYTT